MRIWRSLYALAFVLFLTAGATGAQAEDTTLFRLWEKKPGDAPFLSATANSERGLAYNPVTGHLLLVSRTPGLGIHIIRASDGAVLGQLSVQGVSGGTFFLNKIGVADDGAIYAGNLTLDSLSSPFRLYRWSSESASPQLIFSGDPSGGHSDVRNRRFGDSLALSGSGAETHLLLGTLDGNRLSLLRQGSNSAWTATPLATTLPLGHSSNLAFGENGLFYATHAGRDLHELRLNLTTTPSPSVTLLRSLDGTRAFADLAPVAIDSATNRLVGVRTSAHTVALYDRSSWDTAGAVAPQAEFPFSTAHTNGNGTGAIAVHGQNLYALNTNNGLLALRLGDHVPQAPQSYMEWIGAFGLPPHRRGEDDDPDGDGVANLLEYAFERGSPTRAGRAILPVAEEVEHQGEKFPALTIRRNPFARDLAFAIEVSSDLVHWTSGPEAVVTVTDEPGLLIARDVVPTRENTRRFFRLRVVHGIPETRATWLTTTANTALSTPAATTATMSGLSNIGLNTVYVEVWKNGYTQFPSPTLFQTIGYDRTPSLGSRDLLQETLIQAHRQGLLHLAWFEYGFMAAHSGTQNHLRTLKPEWLSQDINGNTVAPNGFVWMNPVHPEVQDFLIGIVLDAVRAYDLDGIQLDDRLAWPYFTMGYDPYTRALYAAEHNGRQPPANGSDPAWLRWRANKVTAFARRLHQEVRAAHPGLLISVSPAPFPWCYDNYAVDWPAWAAEGLFDEYVPQVYRLDFPAFQSEWNRQLTAIGSRRSDLIAGIRIVGSGADTPWSDVLAKIESARASASGGHSLWFSRGVLDLYPDQTRAFYAEKAAYHPKRGRSWRPLPIPAIRPGGTGNTWTAEVPREGRYRVVVRRGATWTEQESRSFAVGSNNITVASADQVELLLDRRAP